MAPVRRTPSTTREIGRSPTCGVEPTFAVWPAAGVYQLHLSMRSRCRVRVGRLGTHVLLPGEYVYTGRSSRGLVARVMRYARLAGAGIVAETRQGVDSPTLHWHIDYLLVARPVRLERIGLVSHDPADECAANQALRGMAPIARFGAGDCVAGCPAHLVLIGRT